MKGKLRLVRQTKRHICYSLPDIRLLNDRFISGLNWPAEKALLLFPLSPKNMRRPGVVRDMVSKRHYVCRLSWMAHRSRLNGGGTGFGLELKPFKDISEHRRTEKMLHKKYFLEPFKDYMDPLYEKDAEGYFREALPEANAVTVRRGGKIVSMLTLLELKDKGPYRPMHWITWIWVDPALPKEERLVVHGLLRGWVKENSKKYVGASVHAVNQRSQKWFLNSGFKPIRVLFSRRQKAKK